jgi:hypothetical protein
MWRPETLWDATSGGSLVAADGQIARVDDVSGNGHHMTQGTSSARPVRKVAARNGLDVARFDGSDDFLSAGDVADMLNKSVEVYVCLIRTGASGLKGFFGKSRAAAASGRFSLLIDSGNDNFLIQDDASGGQSAVLTALSSLQLLYGHCSRPGNGTAFLERNRSTVASSSVDVGSISRNTTDVLMMGAYQSTGGNAPFSGSFTGGDFLEAGKFSRDLGAHVRTRLSHSIMRRARIAG